MRLSSHPSIVVWGGNNEIETSLGWYDETRSNPHLFAVDYAALFLGVIQTEVEQVGV
jgi:beta-galactosidase/beta-glucuronidase